MASVITLLIEQPDLGQSILLIGSWIATVFVSGVNLAFIFSFFIVFIVLIGGILFLMPEKFDYIINRLNTFLDPSKGDNFQSSKALDAIKQGGLTGQGMGEGILKDSVPEAHTDYIIAIISEGVWICCFNYDYLYFFIYFFSNNKNMHYSKRRIFKNFPMRTFITSYFPNIYTYWCKY